MESKIINPHKDKSILDFSRLQSLVNLQNKTLVIFKACPLLASYFVEVEMNKQGAQ